jgi:hypothetical protein
MASLTARWGAERWLLAIPALLVGAWLSLGHVGAPYLVLLEEAAGPYLVSALADPDVGVGTFIVQLTLSDGQPAPAGVAITLRVRPHDGHLGESAAYLAERTQTARGERFVAKVPFDAKGWWTVWLTVSGPAGEEVVEFSVRVTPAGPDILTSLACLVPFSAAAVLWFMGARRRRGSPADENQTISKNAS